MEITKVKYDGEKVTIKTQEDSDTSQKETTLTCYDPPRESFTDAFQALREGAVDLLEIQDADWAAGLRVTGMSVTYEEERTGVVVTMMKELEGAKGPLVLNTPYVVDEDEHGPTMPTALMRGYQRMLDEARKYLNGDRAQRDLFRDGSEAA